MTIILEPSLNPLRSRSRAVQGPGCCGFLLGCSRVSGRSLFLCLCLDTPIDKLLIKERLASGEKSSWLSLFIRHASGRCPKYSLSYPTVSTMAQHSACDARGTTG